VGEKASVEESTQSSDDMMMGIMGALVNVKGRNLVSVEAGGMQGECQL
jgi:hypothetical protein